MTRRAVIALACLALGACAELAARSSPPPRPSGPPPIQWVAAVDEGAGRYIQVTLSRPDLEFDVKSAALNLPGKPPVAASEIRRASVLGETTVARPPIAVDVVGGSRSGVSTGVGISIPIGRQGTIRQVIVILPIDDPRAYRSQHAAASITIVVIEPSGQQRELSGAAPPPR